MKQKMLIFTLLLMLISSPNFAEDNVYYKVELVVFKQLSKQAWLSEHWPSIFPLNLSPQIIELEQNLSGSGIQFYQPLGPTQALLNPQVHRLSTHGAYEVLLHQTWLQPIEHHPVSIHFHAGKLLDNHGNEIVHQERFNDPANETMVISELDGALTLSKAHFINAGLQMILAEPEIQLDPESSQKKVHFFKLTEKRHMRSNELNYFDHPLFGALLKIMPTSK